MGEGLGLRLHGLLAERFGDSALAAQDARRWLVIGDHASRSSMVDLQSDGVVRLYLGREVFALPAQSEEDLVHVVDFVAAVRAGLAHEIFGFDTKGSLGFIGFHVDDGRDVRYLRIDDGAEPVLCIAV